MANSTLQATGIGSKNRNAALAAEFWATLEATHGNSAQAKSLLAIVKRAEARYARKVERMALKALKSGASESAVVETIERPAASKPASKRASKPASKARTVEVEDDAALAADLPARESFVARMRALAAANEAEGVRV